MPQVIETSEKKIDTSYIQFVHFKDLIYWDFNTYFRTQKNNYHYPAVKLEEVISQRKWSITIDDDIKYKRPTVKLYGGGVFLRDEVLWKDIKVKRQQICRANDLLVAEIDAKVWGFGIIPDYLEGAIVSSHYFLFEVDTSRLDLEYIGIYIKTAEFQKQVQATWSTNYAAIRPHHFLSYTIPLPDIATQKRIVSAYYAKIDEANRLDALVIEKEKEIENYLMETLSVTIENAEKKVWLNFVRFKNLWSWTIDDNLWVSKIKSSKYAVVKLWETSFVEKASRGKSPKYADNTKALILNQKCNRWDYIDIQYAKSVDQSWFDEIKDWIKTKLGDIIINSTWEWTLWRSSLVREWFEWLLYDSHMLLLRVDNRFLNPEFIVKQINSPFFQKQIDSIKWARATNQTELWVDNLLGLYFVIPEDIKIQNSIVSYIESIKNDILAYKEKSDELKQEAKEDFEKELFSI